MQALIGLLHRQRDVGRVASRAYGALVSSDKSPYLRFSSPMPANIDHSPLLATLPETQITTLPNGMRVATETIPFAETATVGVWINSGSRFETDANNGVANFLERIHFKGTKTRTAKELAIEVDSMGGKLSAYTGREQTCFSANVLGKDVKKGVDILSDILLNSNLDENAINVERDIILREMEDQVTKDSSGLLFDHLHATAFQHSPLGRTIRGPVNNVKSMNRDHLAQYVKTHYRGPRMVLAAAGAVNHDELVKMATDAFGSVPDEDMSSSIRTMLQKEPALYTGSYVHDRFPGATECAMAVAFRGASATDPDSVPLMVMQAMLGSYDCNSTVGKHATSQLTQTVAVEGLADSFKAFSTSYLDSGLFGVYGVTDRNHCEDFSHSVLSQMTKMCYDVKEWDVTRAKNQIKASLLFSQDSTQDVAESIGRDLLVYGRRMPKAELLARIDAVDANTVRAVADRFIYDQDMVVSAVGDAQYMPDYNWFRRRSYWLRY